MGDRDVEVTILRAFDDVAAVISERIEARGDEVNDEAPFATESLQYWQRKGRRLDEAGFRNPFDLVAMLVIAQLHAVVDYLRGIGTISVHGRSPGRETAFSAAPIARALLESLAKIYWLAEEGIGADERVRRLVDDTIRDESSRHRVLGHLQGVDAAELLEVDYLVALCEQYEVEWRWGKAHRETGVKFPVLTGVTRPGAFELLSPLMPSERHGQLGAVFYSLMSDVAHASTRGLVGPATVTDDGDRLHLKYERRAILQGVVPALWAANQPVRSAYRYFGWAEEEVIETFAVAVGRLADLATEAT